MSRRKEIIKIRAEINEKIDETRSLFFDKISKINKLLTRVIKKERGLKSIKLELKRSYNGHHRNTRYCKRLLQAIYANKMDNLEERDKFLEKYIFPRLKQK